ncbi:ABC transporter ATP-binding protein [Magnetofaba australis]|uniref:Putative ABC transporter n=1 Tax=Magnetofaba australis IT-1 TaxID=1434232 RepID=A0A1Y2K669_9PROT|nr:ABC transporter ATP-binding protein [Magnetofaba australis]OSM04848.1 putative ABC transporter [Magnetofaba australis IT-1]
MAAQPFLHRIRHLLPYYRQHRWSFAFGFLLLAATSITAAGVPYLLKLATEAFEAGADGQIMLPYAAGMAGLALLHAGLRIAARLRIFGVGREVEYAVRDDYHAKLQELDAPFFAKERVGDLVSRGTNDITALRMFMGPGFLQVSNAAMAYTVTLPLMLALDPMMTLMALAPFPLVLFSARKLTQKLYRLSRAVADRFGDLSAFVQESVAGAAVVRAHAQEASWRNQFAEQSEILYQSHLEHARLQGLFQPMVMFSGGVGGWIILAYGGHRVAAGTLTIGDFVAFTGYLVLLIQPTVGLGWILTVMQRGLAAIDRISLVLNSHPTILPPQSAQSHKDAPLPKQAAISVRALNFAYPSAPNKDADAQSDAAPIDPPHALREINLEIPAGAFVGLAGRVGSGKSTLLKCMARLLPSARDAIAIDGSPLLDIPEARLRKLLTMTPQESFLFSKSVRENLLYGAPGAREELAWRVAEEAAFDDEIRQFPDGIESLVGERGITLSGGQRQRAALARALVMDAPILLLDDVFSSVDAHTEELILNKLQEQAGQRTIVMVCQRVAALHRADVIHLMEHGRIVDSGPHSELMARSALYRDLHLQLERVEALEALR